MLAALHSTVMGTVDSDQMGAAAGLYSMLRFMGMAISTAIGRGGVTVFLRCKFDHARRLPEGVYGACDISRSGDDRWHLGCGKIEL